jgi:hypothetical protein
MIYSSYEWDAIHLLNEMDPQVGPWKKNPSWHQEADAATLHQPSHPSPQATKREKPQTKNHGNMGHATLVYGWEVWMFHFRRYFAHFSSLRNLTQCAAPQSCVFQPTCFNQILANWGIILIKSHEITIVFLQIPCASH